MWGDNIVIVSSPWLAGLLRPFSYFHFLRIKLRPSFVNEARVADYPRVLHEWGDRAPLFRLPEKIDRAGREALRAMGLPDDAWFACVHSRDGIFSPGDEVIHDYRNCRIENYGLAVDEIIARGGWCIRMGEAGTEPLAARPGLVNYAGSAFKSDWMDIFLCAKARFFLGNTSGLFIVSTVAGVPSALANMIHIGSCYGHSPADISIPKHLRERNGAELSFADILHSPIGNFRESRQYRDVGIEILENTPEEIRDLAVEMLERLEGRLAYTAEDEARQQAFRALMRPHHHTCESHARIGSAFLEENERLLYEDARPLADEKART
jgi:putative glycosyltransferase (TIGR04372 family)